MNVLIRLYASYRETAGLDRVTLALGDGAVVADAVEALLAAAPALPRDFRPHLIAVNEEFGNLAYPLHDGDDVAFYPPVSGGVDVWVGSDEIDVGATADAVKRAFNGAVVTFEGTTRDNTAGRPVLRLEYEADERMAHKVIGQILEETMARFDVPAISARHRIGRLEIGDVSLVVAVGAPHRLEAFLAGLYVVDRIKHVVPVWKKEHFADGEVWVGVACDPETHALHLSEAPYAGFLAEREGSPPHVHAHA
ncbi:MAG: molybdenum cofactor biosynthesis protein MoaE [Chloroflexi bacterium]|nr:molybdenum cofactor biosynthesis protein MoaE [Chloroflexota bacterium]